MCYLLSRESYYSILSRIGSVYADVLYVLKTRVLRNFVWVRTVFSQQFTTGSFLSAFLIYEFII